MEKRLKITISIIMEIILLIVSISTIVLSMKYDFSIITPMIFLGFSQLCIFILLANKKTENKS